MQVFKAFFKISKKKLGMVIGNPYTFELEGTIPIAFCFMWKLQNLSFGIRICFIEGRFCIATLYILINILKEINKTI